MNEIVIFGGGETALLAYQYFLYDSDYVVVAFAIDKEFIDESVVYDLPVIDIEDVKNIYPPEQFKGFVAASSTRLNRVREDLYNRAKKMGYELVSYISSKAFIWPNVKFGDNCFILENNTLQPFTEVGNNVVMWSGNHLGHRSKINDHCFISSHCVISGFCEIGSFSFLGVNSTIEDNVMIEKDNFIGAGALIRKNTIEKGFFQILPTDCSKINSHRLFRIKE